MSVELKYKHQRKTYGLMKDSLKKYKRSAHIYPMGGGKSFPPLKYMEEYPNKKVLLVTPNTITINQFKRYISQYILDGKKVDKNTYGNFRAVTYQKVALVKAILDFKPDVIVFDEIHRMGAENWEPAIDELIAANPDAEIIGMTATPERTDKRNMAYEKFGNHIVYEMSLTEALSGSKEDEVVLNGAKYYKVLSAFKDELKQYKEKIDLEDDEKKKQRLLNKFEKLNSIVSNAPGISDIMESALKKKNGKYIVFCANREDMFEKMKQAQEIFGKVNSNIKVDYIISKKDGKGKSQRENRKTIEEFELRENGASLNLLFCVDMLNEGSHIKGIDGEIQFKPTDSKLRYKQIVGRVLTTDLDADETVIVDAVNNWIRQIDTYLELQGAVRKGSKTKGDNKEEKDQELLQLTDEEMEFLDVLKEIKEDLEYKKDTYIEVIKWLETHDGNMPRGNISKNGVQIKARDLSEEERYERNLYARWCRSEERRILYEYIGVPISKFPVELEEYKEKIDELRSYGLGLEKVTTYDEIIEWLETHDGKMPISQKTRNYNKLKPQDLTEDEKYQIRLYNRWKNSPEYRALRACEGLELDEIPEEYIEFKDKIEVLRGYGLDQKLVYDEIVEWLETHDGEMPHGSKMIKRKQLRVEDLSEEERFERNLYARWNRSKEREALEACKGIKLDELPSKYSEYREQIKLLRSYGLGKTTYEELIEWLEEHEGNLPRGIITKNGKRLKTAELTKEEQYERNLYYRMGRMDEYIAYKETKGIDIKDLPEEYAQYKEQIIRLREFEQMRLNNQVLKEMKKSVGKQIEHNESTRAELSNLVKEVEESKDERKK